LKNFFRKIFFLENKLQGSTLRYAVINLGKEI
jgi:hypothetical protein